MKDNMPKARALTRNELKSLRNAGLDPAFSENDVTLKLNAEMVDWILDNVYSGSDFSNVSYPDCLGLATKTYQKTYSVTEDEAKNS